MGCHTWAAYKSNRTIDEARRIWIKHQKEKLENDSYIDYFPVLERQLNMVEKGLCNVAVFRNQPEHSYYIPNKGLYIICDDFHDMFRVCGYPDDECFSLQETLDFISNYEKENNCKIEIFHLDGHEKNTLEEFWEKYPDGYIHFG